MSYYTIAGRPNCPHFVHAIYVANYLKSRLPLFDFKKIEKEGDAWKFLIEDLNVKNKWKMFKSPIIWKEITYFGGKSYLIGGLGEFWEYCFDYYGLHSFIPREELDKLTYENYNIFKIFQKPKEKDLIISIIGSSSLILEFLLNELEETLNLDQSKFDIRLLNEDNYEKEDNIILVTSMKDLLKNCDLLIILDDYTIKDNEDKFSWLNRCFANMHYLSNEINAFAKHSLRIILAHPGPVCFNATILMQFCTTIRLSNIIAVTADEGLPYISNLSKLTNISLNDTYSPIVWGSPYLEMFIDTKNVIIKGSIKRPYWRAIKAKGDTSLLKGKIDYELRTTEYLDEDIDNISFVVEKNKGKIIDLLKRPPVLSKVISTLKLIKAWYQHENCILSLGICSNGCFGFPTGIIISQPCELNDENMWQPCNEFPIEKIPKEKIEYMTQNITAITQQFGYSKEDIL